jgi:hypothetical protein
MSDEAKRVSRRGRERPSRSRRISDDVTAADNEPREGSDERLLLDLLEEGVQRATSGDIEEWLGRVIRLPAVRVLEQETTDITVLARVSKACLLHGQTEAALTIAKSLLERCTNLLFTARSVAHEHKTYRYDYGCDVGELRSAVEAAMLVVRAAVLERDEEAARNAMAVIAALPAWGDSQWEDTHEVPDVVGAFVNLWPPEETFLAQAWLRASSLAAPVEAVTLRVGDLVDWQVRAVLPALLFWAAPELQSRAGELVRLPPADRIVTATEIEDLGRTLGIFDASGSGRWEWMLLGSSGLVAGTEVPNDLGFWTGVQFDEAAITSVMAALGDIPDPRLGAVGRIGMGTEWGTEVWLMTRTDSDCAWDPRSNPWTTLLDSIGETIRTVLTYGLDRHRKNGVARADDLQFLSEQFIPRLQQDLIGRMKIKPPAGQQPTGGRADPPE